MKEFCRKHNRTITWVIVGIILLTFAGVVWKHQQWVKERNETKELAMVQLNMLQESEKEYWESILQIKSSVSDKDIPFDKVQENIKYAKEKGNHFKETVSLNEKLHDRLTKSEQAQFDRMTEAYAMEIDKFDTAMTNLDSGIELLRRGGSCGDKFYDDMRDTLTDAVRSQVTAMTIQENLRKEFTK